MQVQQSSAPPDDVEFRVELPAVFPTEHTVTIGKWLPNVPIEAYHGDKRAVSRSGLWHMLRTPRAFMHEWQKPYRPATAVKGAFRTGDLAHMAIGEPDRFRKECIAMPDFGDMRYANNKAARAEFLAEHADKKHFLTPAEMQQLEGMVDAVYTHPVACKLLDGGESEVTGYWVDQETGVLCRIRPDKLHVQSGICPDVKTTDDASEGAFWRSVVKYGYHFQAGMYAEGISAITAIPYEQVAFAIVAIEKEQPHGVNIYTLDSEDMLRARMLVRHALRALAVCIDTDEWPSYPTPVRSLRLPDYAYSVRR